VAANLLVTAAILAVPILLSAGAPPAALVLIATLAIGPASDLAIALVNRVVARVFGPARLPRLDLDSGVPEALPTLVVVPTLLTDEASVERQVANLEVHFLANREGDVRFALLSDWVDAPTEHLPDDEAILGSAVAAIERLNEAHGEAPGGGARFLLFHRARRWNEGEGCWMGWERKRGKLEELNRLLRGATDTTILQTGRPSSSAPPAVRYVVTLDADTRLPRGAVGQLVGAMAHPLNRPRFEPVTRRVTEGYGLLQPRITAVLPAEHEASLFQRIFSGPAGIDPYSAAVSDVYQDLFGEGTFTGKGIYDVDAFAAALAGRVPENAILSHDLFEGIFARAGLVTDIELFDEYPSNALVEASRQHRWTRGDWQMLPWILGGARDATGVRRRGAIPAIGRWKMVDNLRRSLSAPLALATLAAAWAIPSVPAGVWTAFVLLTILIPPAIPVIAGLPPRREGISKRSHLRAVADDAATAAARIGLSLVLLSHQAWLMGDAIVRTLARVYLTRRHLLEWTTAAEAKSIHSLELGAFHRRMAGGLALAVVVLAAVVVADPGALWLAAPFIVAWLLAPTVACWASRPPAESQADQLSTEEVRTIRLTARETWRCFEDFVVPDRHFLPPDNHQDDPAPLTAERTSPTNIGMYLLSTVAARDFGWIGTIDMIERIEATLTTIDRLERFRGHLYNWYDTRTLRALEPMYVSSVDSGNLAGHLLVVANVCRDLVDRPSPHRAALDGIGDALALARRAASALGDDRPSQTVSRRHLDEALAAVAAALDDPIRREAEPPVTEQWRERLELLRVRADELGDVVAALTAETGAADGRDLVRWAAATRAAVEGHRRDLAELGAPDPAASTSGASAILVGDGGAPATDRAGLERRVRAIAEHAQHVFDEMDFTFLFDPVRKLFSIGYRTRDGTLDPSYYDLLASEARLTSFLAIAKGDVPAEHWFRLGRSLTPVGRGSALVSWSGSMFEYLMPSLVMREPFESLLGQTNRLVVARQMSYASERGVPWGISESGFNARDLEQAYQYSSFGVPGLGLKRGLREDLVVAPYATALGAMIQPRAAVRNMARLARAGASGRYGLCEALDYTPRRLPEGAKVAVVRSWMAHHQGMALVALGNVLNDRVMAARFHADPIVEATELLLHERMPRDVLVARPRSEEAKSAADVRDLVPPVLRRFTSPNDAIPRTHLLSNGRYAVMMTAAGSGYSRWGDIAITRWREDVTRDQWGSYVFIRDRRTGAVWSAGYQPSGAEPASYEVVYAEDHVEMARRDGPIVTGLGVVVSAEHDAEIRRLTISNLGSHDRELDLTSYAELALAPQAADVAHPAFQNLFVETEFVPHLGALVATRRPRSPDERRVWAAHVAAIDEAGGLLEYETDRARFLGRGRSIRSAISIADGRPLSNTVGPVLDPIFSLRRRLKVAAGTTVHATFATVVAGTREEVLDLADKFREVGAYERAATLAWTQAQVQLHHLRIETDEAHLFQRLANRILFSDPSLRPSSTQLARNDRGAAGLWPHGISGDYPIVVLRVAETEDFDIVRQLLRAYGYWRLKLLTTDLVIIDEHGTTYAEDFHAALEGLVRTAQSPIVPGGHPVAGGIHVLRGGQMTLEDRIAIQSVARVVLVSGRGTLAEQVIRVERPEAEPPRPVPPARPHESAPLVLSRPELEFFNGLGGFADDGNEYVTILGPGQSTPAPWVNVVANPRFGFIASESGSGYTWSANSRENQLTPWSNDPVGDPPGEAILIRDDETGELWSPTAQPIRIESATYVTRHGPGLTRFELAHDGLHVGLSQLVPLDEPFKLSVLTIENRTDRVRRLTVTAYAEWVLGTSRGDDAHRIVTSVEPETGALLARNPWNAEFPGRIVFLDLAGAQTAWTCDRTEFLGRNGGLDHPAGLERGVRLREASGAGLDPCAVLQTTVALASGATTEIAVILGEAPDAAAAADLIKRARSLDRAGVMRAVGDHWRSILGTVRVRTPDRSMDVLLNRWLVYQTLACRVWARTATYQAGGAFGFRDQLQDVIALLVARPDIARDQIIAAAGRQFVEGDVQHWWHPPSGRGVRTRISDDRLWLAYAVERYIAATDDRTILDEVAPWLEGAPLEPGQDDRYFQPDFAPEPSSLFDHCAAAIGVSLAPGPHGLPLMGGGDWNDGMNRVGREGRGESVWLGWFLATVLKAFVPIAESRGRADLAGPWRTRLRSLSRALERHGWDGAWYRRAYFDDGTPLGSAVNEECRIDSIAQSWSVLSGVGDAERAKTAMLSVDRELVRRGDGLIQLFDPPFDRSSLDPGYIKGYVPGIRENGGQYTHGAIWSILAFAELGDGDTAAELFSLLNPINHASTRAGVHRYRVEPYVIAADVYAGAPHAGRGGWTWYTGSAGWMYQAGLEWILGFRLRGTRLVIDPCIPRGWRGFEIEYRRAQATVRIAVENPMGVARGVASIELDGSPIADIATGVPLPDDGADHDIRVVLGPVAAGPPATSGARRRLTPEDTVR
jgi:cyclic beta-1,2-glucan synthetase